LALKVSIFSFGWFMYCLSLFGFAEFLLGLSAYHSGIGVEAEGLKVKSLDSPEAF